MKHYVKKGLVSFSLYSLLIAPAGAFSSGGSITASVEGIHTSLIGSVTVSQGLVQVSEATVQASYDAIAASAELGKEMVITSVNFVGDVVELTIQASAAGVEASGEMLEFSLTVSKAAFEASLQGAEQIFEAMVDGVEVAVKSVALVAGATSQVIGHTLVLAATPAVVVGTVLNDLGKQLYAEEL